MKSFKMIFLYLIFCFFIIFGVLFVKQYSYYHAGISYEKKGLYINTIDNYAMVIYMHIPFSIYEKKAINNILKLADKFRDNVTFSLYCYERLRSSIYGTRWLFTPHKNILKKIEPKISIIKTKLLIKDGYKKSYNNTYKELIHIMTTDLSPDPFISLISILLFFSFISITIIAIIKSSRQESFNIKIFALFFPVILMTWILWIIMLYKA